MMVRICSSSARCLASCSSRLCPSPPAPPPPPGPPAPPMGGPREPPPPPPPPPPEAWSWAMRRARISPGERRTDRPRREGLRSEEGSQRSALGAKLPHVKPAGQARTKLSVVVHRVVSGVCCVEGEGGAGAGVVVWRSPGRRRAAAARTDASERRRPVLPTLTPRPHVPPSLPSSPLKVRPVWSGASSGRACARLTRCSRS